MASRLMIGRLIEQLAQATLALQVLVLELCQLLLKRVQLTASVGPDQCGLCLQVIPASTRQSEKGVIKVVVRLAIM